MKKKGLTISIIFEASSANYGEGVGNVASLKKLTRGNGEQYTYISRQAIRYNIVDQMGETLTPIGYEKSVAQFAPDATIKDYPEIDLFGYMKTVKDSKGKTRTAKVRLSNAISLETFKGDLDFLTNKGLTDRIGVYNGIAQSEIHSSYYAYTIAIDLDQVGIDENDGIELDNKEKARRVNKFLDTVAFLYRDIKGRRENLAPLFVIGGVYDIKNPFFENLLTVKNNKINVKQIKGGMFESIKADTDCGLIEGKFSNDDEILETLNPKSVPEFFNELKKKVDEYYESN
jgi:CRISPR-associated protein Cst2